MVKVWIPLLDIQRQPHIELQEDSGQNQLDLVSREEAARTGMLAVPKRCVLLGHADKLVALARPERVRVRHLLVGPQLVESPRVERIRMGINLVVMQDRERRRLDKRARRNVRPVFQRDRLLHVPPEGIWDKYVMVSHHEPNARVHVDNKTYRQTEG